MITVRNACFGYRQADGSTWPVLSGIDLDIAAGELISLIGPNGSGKSTLARLLNGLLQPTSGEVIVEGQNTSRRENLIATRRLVGIVFQNPDNQLVAPKVEEDVAFGPENLGLPSRVIRQRVDEALTLVGLQDLRLHPPAHLSGGQKQRLALAGVLAMRPRYIILDEATSMLDPRGREEILSAVVKINREEQIGVIMITHDMTEAALADRVAVLSNGRLILAGPKREVLTRLENLSAIGLEGPLMVQLAHCLNRTGIKLRPDIMTVAEMVDELCSYK